MDEYERYRIDMRLGFEDALTIAFIVLKLCNVISWRWIWVLAPLWGPAAIAIIKGIVVGARKKETVEVECYEETENDE